MTDPIEEFVNQRGVTSLFHFTRLDNLHSILAHGLLTKEACVRVGVNPSINDPDRFDGTGAISATISYPNYKLFYHLRCHNPGVEWVVLELEASLLWRTRCVFSDTNAGDGSVYNVPISRRHGMAALRSMFVDYGHVQRATLNIPDHYTTNPQAEVLLLDGATLDDGKNIYFQRSATQRLFQAEYPYLPCQFRGSFFDGRRDHMRWK